MYLEQRRNHILEYLDRHETLSVAWLAGTFAVSKETIRSDLAALAGLGLIQRCHGGAMVLRRNLQARLISETGGNFEVLLQRLESQRLNGQRGKRKTQGRRIAAGAWQYAGSGWQRGQSGDGRQPYRGAGALCL